MLICSTNSSYLKIINQLESSSQAYFYYLYGHAGIFLQHCWRPEDCNLLVSLIVMTHNCCN